MLHPTNNKKKSKQAYELKTHRHNINVNDSEAKNSNNFSYDEAVENNNATTNTFYRESDSNKSHRPCYLGNSISTKRRKRQQQREAAKGMPTLFTFWNQDKTAEEDIEVELFDDGWLDEVNEDDTEGLLEDEIETSNWYKKIQTALENITLDIKNKNVNSEVWVRLNSIRFYPQLIKHNYQKIEASKIVADVAGKGVYHARCIRSWSHEYVMTHQIPYLHREHHIKTWSFLWDEDILLQIKSFAPPPTISFNTAKNYLKELERMNELEHRISVFSDEDMKVETWPDSSVQLLILVIHDRKSEDLIEQVSNHAIPIFEAYFPGCQALFAFDNTKSHTTYASDALVAKNMNLSSAGKQEKMCSTSYFLISERELWPEKGLKLQKARELMGQQPDFLAQKGQLEETIIGTRHQIANCNYSWKGLQKTISLALNSVLLPTIRRYVRKAFRYMDAYQKGLKGKVAEFAVKKYRSHRQIPEFALSSIKVD
ncbi:6637_t:CDS:2 [Cetraspora pellucida]|uniref:6637_t:CDS:1 n=1 Tax=Cetraspora pellucida TaxID=1433469 RepID=A0A9N9DC27_9GLOM|nr:6637_t:CDS:2 [Cetraspora pellucida]